MTAIRKSKRIRSQQAWIGGGGLAGLCAGGWGGWGGHSQARLQAPPTAPCVPEPVRAKTGWACRSTQSPALERVHPLGVAWGRPRDALGFGNWPEGTSQRDHEPIRRRHEGLQSPRSESHTRTVPKLGLTQAGLQL